jgi:hypothetical protein
MVSTYHQKMIILKIVSLFYFNTRKKLGIDCI